MARLGRRAGLGGPRRRTGSQLLPRQARSRAAARPAFGGKYGGLDGGGDRPPGSGAFGSGCSRPRRLFHGMTEREHRQRGGIEPPFSGGERVNASDYGEKWKLGELRKWLRTWVPSLRV